MPLPEIHYDEWFHKPHPHDSMPIATDVGEWLPENGDEPPESEEIIHEKMYKIATDKYNPFSISIINFISFIKNITFWSM